MIRPACFARGTRPCVECMWPLRKSCECVDFIGLPSHARNMARTPWAKSSILAACHKFGRFAKNSAKLRTAWGHLARLASDSQHHWADPGAPLHFARSAGCAPQNWRKAKTSSGIRRSNAYEYRAAICRGVLQV